MKKTLIVVALLFFSVASAHTPPMFKQAQRNHTETTYCNSLRSVLVDRTKQAIFWDVLTDFVNARCFDVLKK
jgi:hypothetical protein